PQHLAAVRNHPSDHPVPAARRIWRGRLDAGYQRGAPRGLLRGAAARGNGAHHRNRAWGDDGDSPGGTSLAGANTSLLGYQRASDARAARTGAGDADRDVGPGCDRVAQSLGAILFVVTIGLVWSISRAIGELSSYFLLWTTTLPLVLIVGWAALLIKIAPARWLVRASSSMRARALAAGTVAAL